MKPHLISAGAAIVLALLMTGCESDGGVSARKKEKSEVYALCRPWQKELIEKGVIAQEFTPDMVYISLGNPDKVETKDFPEGRAEMWTYTHVYPNVDAIHGFRHADFSTESAYQPQRQTNVKNVERFFGLGNQPTSPLGQGEVGAEGDGPQTSFHVGGPQGASMEPADLRSYTIKVLFASGKVVRFGANENVH